MLIKVFRDDRNDWWLFYDVLCVQKTCIMRGF